MSKISWPYALLAALLCAAAWPARATDAAAFDAAFQQFFDQNGDLEIVDGAPGTEMQTAAKMHVRRLRTVRTVRTVTPRASEDFLSPGVRGQGLAWEGGSRVRCR